MATAKAETAKVAARPKVLANLTCADCTHFGALQHLQGTRGHCRRYPPAGAGLGGAAYSVVSATLAKCGEFMSTDAAPEA